MFSSEKIATAVVTGHHPYDVVGLQRLFRSIPEVDAYPQSMEDFLTDTDEARRRYDAVVFYNFHRPGLDAGGDDLVPQMREAVDELGKTEQGIVVLHHAILAFPDWQRWSDLCGIQERDSTDSAADTPVRIQIADSSHPITTGLEPWENIDETYVMFDAGEGNDVLLTTDHPKSMRTIAWARQFEKARVFCYQSGHDDQTFSNPGFRAALGRGIQWVARRI